MGTRLFGQSFKTRIDRNGTCFAYVDKLAVARCENNDKTNSRNENAKHFKPYKRQLLQQQF